MNILFFLTPKIEVAYINEDDNIQQVMEQMSEHRYSCIPVLTENGKYAGSITEGDLLWGLRDCESLSIDQAREMPVARLKRKRYYEPVHVETDIEDLIGKAMNQNYVPVVDDQNNFIGIITRKDIIQYCYEKIKKQEAE